MARSAKNFTLSIHKQYSSCFSFSSWIFHCLATSVWCGVLSLLLDLIFITSISSSLFGPSACHPSWLPPHWLHLGFPKCLLLLHISSPHLPHIPKSCHQRAMSNISNTVCTGFAWEQKPLLGDWYDPVIQEYFVRLVNRIKGLFNPWKYTKGVSCPIYRHSNLPTVVFRQQLTMSSSGRI